MSTKMADEMRQMMDYVNGHPDFDESRFRSYIRYVEATLGLRWDGDSRAFEESDDVKQDVLEIFRYWRDKREEVLDAQKGPRMKLSKKREGKIRARLREGYTVDQLKEAVDGMLSREHNVKGGYTDIELCLRDQGKVEMFRAHAKISSKPKSNLYKEIV